MKIRIDGIENALQALTTRDHRYAAKLRRAVTVITRRIAKDERRIITARQLLGTGITKKSLTIKIVTMTKKRRGIIGIAGPSKAVFIAGVRDKRNRFVKLRRPWKIAHLIDRGTVARYTRTGKYRGVMPANPFVTSAYTIWQPRVAQAIKQELR